jgi:ATP-binding cassette, subfamily G (WHITE), member 2, PDR
MAASVPWGALAQERALLTSVETRGDALPQQDPSNPAPGEDDSANREKQVASLARTFTQASAKSKDGLNVNPFLGSDDPLLDPNSGKFSAQAWVKTLVGVQSRDPERYPKRTAGVAYR